MWFVYRYWSDLHLWTFKMRFDTEQEAQIYLAKLALKDGGQYRIVKEE